MRSSSQSSGNVQDGPAFEILLLFEETVLAVVYLGPTAPCQRRLVLGETDRGREPDFAVAAETLGTGRRQLEVARWHHGHLLLELPRDSLARGTVYPGFPVDGPRPLAALPGLLSLEGQTYRLALPAGMTARFPVAGLTLLCRPTSCPERLPRAGLLAGLGWRDGRCTVWSALGHALLLVLLFSVPGQARMAVAAELLSPGQLIAVTHRPRALANRVDIGPHGRGNARRGDGRPGQGGRESGRPAPGADGQAGLRTSQKVDRAAAVRRRPDRPPALRLPSKRLAPKLEARRAGLLGILRADRTTLGALFEETSVLGEHAQDALGHLNGAVVGDAWGVDGLGLRGTGPGAGCLLEGTCSTVASTGKGRVGTRLGGGTGDGATCGPFDEERAVGCRLGSMGKGSGRGRGFHLAGSPAGLGSRRGGVPTPEVRVRVETPDGLSAEVVRRVIRRHVSEVKYCYEKELTTRPDLFGRVVLSLLIGPAGPVVQSTIAQSTLAHPPADACIADAARRWTFPASARATRVTYPFVLQSAGR